MENKNKFWKGVMAGVFATAFVCLAAVAASVGIYMFGSQTLTRAQNSSGEASGEAASLDMEQVNQKLGVILDLINEVYLFDTDPWEIYTRITTRRRKWRPCRSRPQANTAESEP